jgi:large subunit ribosomal protein L21
MADYAVVKTDGREYKVAEGDVLALDYRKNAKAGDKIVLGDVMMTSRGGKVSIGKPMVTGASVEAEVLDPLMKGPKIRGNLHLTISRVRIRYGHRQKYTKVKVTAIKA